MITFEERKRVAVAMLLIIMHATVMYNIWPKRFRSRTRGCKRRRICEDGMETAAMELTNAATVLAASLWPQDDAGIWQALKMIPDMSVKDKIDGMDLLVKNRDLANIFNNMKDEDKKPWLLGKLGRDSGVIEGVVPGSIA